MWVCDVFCSEGTLELIGNHKRIRALSFPSSAFNVSSQRVCVCVCVRVPRLKVSCFLTHLRENGSFHHRHSMFSCFFLESWKKQKNRHAKAEWKYNPEQSEQKNTICTLHTQELTYWNNCEVAHYFLILHLEIQTSLLACCNTAVQKVNTEFITAGSNVCLNTQAKYFSSNIH